MPDQSPSSDFQALLSQHTVKDADTSPLPTLIGEEGAPSPLPIPSASPKPSRLPDDSLPSLADFDFSLPEIGTPEPQEAPSRPEQAAASTVEAQIDADVDERLSRHDEGMEPLSLPPDSGRMFSSIKPYDEKLRQQALAEQRAVFMDADTCSAIAQDIHAVEGKLSDRTDLSFDYASFIETNNTTLHTFKTRLDDLQGRLIRIDRKLFS